MKKLAAILVLLMTVPGLALFYGGLVRTKNMLSVLMQCTMITAVVMIIWVLYGYSFAFGGGTSPFWGGFAKALIFMPMAISFVGAAVIWKLVYEFRRRFLAYPRTSGVVVGRVAH